MTRLCPLLVVALAALGCDELGNPMREHGPTPPLAWEDPLVILETHTDTVPAEHLDGLVRGVPPELLFHAERPQPGGVATLVVVRPRWRRPVPAGTVRLVTEMRLADGTIERHRWSATTPALTWYALMAPAAAPLAAATALER